MNEQKCSYIGCGETAVEYVSTNSYGLWVCLKHGGRKKEDKLSKLKSYIFEVAHLEECSVFCREYFKECDLEMNDVNMDNVEKLNELIQEEIDVLSTDLSYNLVKKLRMEKKIRQNKEGIYLYVCGDYFKHRHAITFYFQDKIIFCSWATGCNRIPFVKGFINWCDWMVQTKK